VDVKGDTTVSFTVPYIYETDLKPVTSLGGYAGIQTCQLLISVYNPLVASDASVDATIDLVTWVSAASDCQFALPCHTTNIFSYPNAAPVVPQCDIRTEFENTFEPFVEGCSELTDQKLVNAEYSDSILDVLKRYQLYSTSWVYTTPVSLDFVPSSATLASTLASLFLFHRGGVSYRTQNTDPTKISGLIVNYACSSAIGVVSGEAQGQPFINITQQDGEANFSVPWYCNVPYILRNASGASCGGYNTTQQSIYTSQYGPLSTTGGASLVHICVRDDYAVGFLIPPFPPGGSSALAAKRRQDRKVLVDSRQPHF
jgi:hypothetical protein